MICVSASKNPPVNEPEIKKVTVRDNRVAVAVNAPKNSKGYDCVLASSWIEDKPYKCDYVIKDQTGSVARFKNVKPGTYYLSTHAFVREKLNTGKKVFSTWTPPRKIVIK